MKKNFFLVTIPFVFLFFSCSTLKKTVDNTFLTNIENNLNYEITIDNDVIPANSSKEHKFPLYDNGIYNDLWKFNYKIPLTDSVHYNLTDVVSITNKQKKVVIENSNKPFIEESYVIIQNKTNNNFYITDAQNEKRIPCYEKGIINYDKNNEISYYIQPDSSVVCKNEHFTLYLSDTLSKYELIALEVPYKKGYIYTVLLENEKVYNRTFHSLQDFLINSKSTPGPASIVNYAPSSSIKIGNLKPVALCIGAEANRNSREDFIAPGISASFDYNFFKKVSLGIKMFTSYDVKAKDDNLLILEPLAFLRVYMVYYSGEPGTGIFLEGLGGVSIVSSINSDTNIIPNGGLGLGYRLPIKWLYIEPEIRFGYPYTYGASLNLGFRF